LGEGGGIQVVEIEKANALAARGCDVTICFADRYDYPWTPRPVSERVRVVDLGTPVRQDSGMSVWSYFKLSRRFRKALQRLVEEIKPDVLVSTGQQTKYVVPFIRSPKGHKMVKIREYHFCSQRALILAASKLSYLKGLLLFWLEKYVLACFYDKVFLLTNKDKNENFRHAQKFDVMYNPLTLSSISSAEPERKKQAIFVGRLADKQKNISSLLHIWSMAHIDGWKLILAGDGPDREMLEAYARQLKISDSVQFVGWLDNPSEMLLESSVFCLTSRIEGFALCLVEAMAFGLPVVSFDLPCGPSDLITDGEDGYLIPNGDENMFAQRLSDLLADEGKIAEMGAAARVKSKQFSVDKIANQWMAIFHNLLARK
jgi:glycosyltransferase involved in cell wall biosynthesis